MHEVSFSVQSHSCQSLVFLRKAILTVVLLCAALVIGDAEHFPVDAQGEETRNTGLQHALQS